MTQKPKLKEIKLKSFVTQIQAEETRGGRFTIQFTCRYEECGTPPVSRDCQTLFC
ncbi:MAG: hypothetical protein QNK37_12680 [Acidobacteriota bacterium]|nr:hypothetical protein [Acidobacteriota bacterium]